jgi:Spy/CpxP family protein refolding chaperone
MNFKPFLLAAGLTMAITGGAYADHEGGGWHHGGGDLAFLHGVNLTDAQQAQVKEIQHTNWAQLKPIMKQVHAIHEQIASGFLAGQTAEQLSGLVSQEEALRTQLDSARLATAVQIRGILSPAQLSQAADTHAKMQALRAQEHEVMGHGETPAQ